MRFAKHTTYAFSANDLNQGLIHTVYPLAVYVSPAEPPSSTQTRFRLLTSFTGRDWGPLGSSARFQVIHSSLRSLGLAQ